MNGCKAKLLRKITNKTVPNRPTIYKHHVVKRVAVPTGELMADGLPETKIDVRTMCVMEHCTRRSYQLVKQFYKSGGTL